MWSAIQEERVRLFELGDVVTWPVQLVDAGSDDGWPEHIGVETTVIVESTGRGRWAATESGLRVRTQLSGPAAAGVATRAALTVVAFPMSAWGLSYVTGTVRRIELASVASPELGDPAQPVISDERWTLIGTPVAPVRFRDPFGGRRSEIWDQGIVVHLELFTPRCRCRDIGGLMPPEADRYAQRHLQVIAHDREAETVHFVPEHGRDVAATSLEAHSSAWRPAAVGADGPRPTRHRSAGPKGSVRGVLRLRLPPSSRRRQRAVRSLLLRRQPGHELAAAASIHRRRHAGRSGPATCLKVRVCGGLASLNAGDGKRPRA